MNKNLYQELKEFYGAMLVGLLVCIPIAGLLAIASAKSFKQGLLGIGLLCLTPFCSYIINNKILK